MSALSILPLILAVLAPLQTDRPKDAFALVSEVCHRYADAKSYHIEAVEERTTSSELSRSWQKSMMTAIAVPGGRYRYEGVSLVGKALLISDGKQEWEYILGRKAFSQQSLGEDASAKKMVHAPESITARNAKAIVQTLAQIAGNLKSASYLPDETLIVGDKKLDCYVINISEADFKTHLPFATRRSKLWIDKERHFIVKRTERVEPIAKSPEAPWRAFTSDALTTYIADLNAQEPDSSFTFDPPKDAVLVTDFAAPDQGITVLMGKLAPEIRFRGPDGKIFTLSSLQGKPVFLDFWASWCGPCNSAIPDLLKLHANTSSKGLTWIGIDNDSNPDAAEKFAKEQGIPWPNYHDLDGSMGAAFMRHTLPLGVLLNAQGKIIFYKPGYQVSELRGAIATLGPELAAAVGTGEN